MGEEVVREVQSFHVHHCSRDRPAFRSHIRVGASYKIGVDISRMDLDAGRRK